MHHPAGGEVLVLAMDNDRHIQRRGVFQRPAHQGGIHDRFPVVGETDGAGVLEIPEFAEEGTFRLHGDRCNRIDICQAAFRRFSPDEFGHGPTVVDGIRVGHAGDGAEAARNGGLASGSDRLFVLVSRFPQMGVHIDQAGNDYLPAEIQYSQHRRAFPLSGEPSRF